MLRNGSKEAWAVTSLQNSQFGEDLSSCVQCTWYLWRSVLWSMFLRVVWPQMPISIEWCVDSWEACGRALEKLFTEPTGGRAFTLPRKHGVQHILREACSDSCSFWVPVSSDKKWLHRAMETYSPAESTVSWVLLTRKTQSRRHL